MKPRFCFWLCTIKLILYAIISVESRKTQSLSELHIQIQQELGLLEGLEDI